MFILIFINPQYTVLYILSHCTSYSLFYFIICSYFHSHLYLYIYIYIYIFSCVMFHCFSAFYFLLYFFFFFFLHFPLSGPVRTYISLLIIPCMIVYVTNNKEPWTLRYRCRQHVYYWKLWYFRQTHTLGGKKRYKSCHWIDTIWKGTDL